MATDSPVTPEPITAQAVCPARHHHPTAPQAWACYVCGSPEAGPAGAVEVVLSPSSLAARLIELGGAYANLGNAVRKIRAPSEWEAAKSRLEAAEDQLHAHPDYRLDQKEGANDA